MSLLSELRPALEITRREVRDQLRDWRIIFPILGLTVFFPFLMNFTARSALNFVQQYGASILAERLVPFLFMVVGFFPISVSLVIALETFVGEKERGSIEPLLNTPLKDWQLYLGKLLSATVPPLFSSYLGMSVYLIGLTINKVPIPNALLLFQLVALTTVQAVVMVAGAVIVSTQTTTVRAANLLASFIVIPSALLIQGESVVVFWGNFSTLWWAVLGMAVFAILLVRVGLAHFHREELLGREIDILNFRWGWRIFAGSFMSGSRSLGSWYKSVWGSLKKLRWPIVFVVSILAASLWIGYKQAEVFRFPLDQVGLSDIKSRIGGVLPAWKVGDFTPILGLLWQNIRVLVLAMPLGFFSFGVLGVLPGVATIGITGYLMGLLSQIGISPFTYLVGFILPHGIFEMSAAVISTASVLWMGALMASPQTQKTVSEVWLASVAEWAKIMVGIVVPLLIIAAFVEAWITPWVISQMFR